MANKLFTTYTDLSCPSTTRANIEFIAPILCKVLPKENKLQIVRSVDQLMIKGNATIMKSALAFIDIVEGTKYLSIRVKKYITKPLIDSLNENLDNWYEENEFVKALEPYAGYIPTELLYDYVNGLTQTYIGYIGGSNIWDRTDFYSDGAAERIPRMFEKFDDESADKFVEVIKNNKIIISRVQNDIKLNRLRILGRIVLNRISSRFRERNILEVLVDEEKNRIYFIN